MEPALPLTTTPKVLNWPPGKDVVKTKHVKVKFVYSEIPQGRGMTPEPERGWGRRYRRAPLPDQPVKSLAPASAATPAGAAGMMSASASAAPAAQSAAAAHITPLAASASAVQSSDAVSTGSGGRAESSKAKADKTEKAPKQAPKVVAELDSVIGALSLVEVFTQGDWWNARIDKIVIMSRKHAIVSVSYEQTPGVYGVQPGDEVEITIRQADGIWVYADRIKRRTDAAAPFAAVPAPMPAAAPVMTAAPPAVAPPQRNVKRELAMDTASVAAVGSVAAVAADSAAPAPAQVSLVETLNKGIASPCAVPGLQDKPVYFPGHPCYWPLYWARAKGTKLVLTKVKEYPHAYKRVRVTHDNNSWSRDLEAERQKRRREGEISPALDGDSNKSSPVLASPLSNAPPPLSHSRGAEPSSDGVLLAPQVLRVSTSGAPQRLAHSDASAHPPEASKADCQGAQMLENGQEPEPSEAGQQRSNSVSPAIDPPPADEQEAAAALRLNAVHALALEDMTRAELKEKLMSKLPRQMLKELASPVEPHGQTDKDKCKYKLLSSLWPEVRIDEWHGYSEDDRQVLRIRMSRASGDASQASRSPPQPVQVHPLTSNKKIYPAYLGLEAFS